MRGVLWSVVCVVTLGLASACVPADELDPVVGDGPSPPEAATLGTSQGAGVEQAVKAPETLENGEPKVLSGQPTLERPEIGSMITNGGAFCTATLIRPNVAITASHCVDFQSRLQTSNYGRFVVTSANGQESRFTIDQIYAFNSMASELDIALLRLAEPVPASVAVPTQIATREATAGEQVAIFGYGCTNRNGGGGTAKRKYTYNYSDSFNLCSGDSGGPVVIGDGGPIFLINSGYIISSGKDVFGLAYQYRAQLIEQIVAWNGSDEVEPTPGVTVTNDTGTGLWVHCGARTSAKCSPWQFLEPGNSGSVMTPDRGLYLWNLRLGAQVEYNLRRVVASGDTATIFANADDPLSEPSQIEPDPNPVPVGSVEITNQTGADLWVHCGLANPASNCDGWTRIPNGQMTLFKTPNQRLYLWNANQNLPEIWDRYRVTAPASRVTIYLNTRDPFSPAR